MSAAMAGLGAKLARLPVFRALRHRDFRLLWLGAFLSFTGSQVQSLAQGYYVYEITGDKAKLAMVMFFFNLPVMILAPFSGVISDRMNRRTVLVVTQILAALNSIFLATFFFLGQLDYWHILVTSFLGGVYSTVEAPTRQSVVRSVVGDEDLPSAIPAQAMTFNLARIVGPAIGGVIAANYGAGACFFINAVSFSGLIYAAMAIRTDLRHAPGEMGRISDLLLDGIRFTWRTVGLRVLFLMETATSIFGMFYLALMPAITKSKLGLDEKGLGLAWSCVGIGAMIGLVTLSSLSDRGLKPVLTKVAMSTVAVALILMGFVSQPWLAYPIFGLIGASAIMQFNATNTLFQQMSPDALRGRVISMHMWAISGLSPVGIFAFGWLAESVSLDAALWLGGGLLAACSALAWIFGSAVQEPPSPQRAVN